jgi:hypothetical protein
MKSRVEYFLLAGSKRWDVRSDYPRDMAVMTMVVEMFAAVVGIGLESIGSRRSCNSWLDSRDRSVNFGIDDEEEDVEDVNVKVLESDAWSERDYATSKHAIYSSDESYFITHYQHYHQNLFKAFHNISNNLEQSASPRHNYIQQGKYLKPHQVINHAGSPKYHPSSPRSLRLDRP